MNRPPTLQDLIEFALARHRVSVGQLALRAQAQGFGLNYTVLEQIRKATYARPASEATIRAIAWLAGVDASVAFTAAGKPNPGPRFADELPIGVDSLSLESRRTAINMLRRLIDLESNADPKSVEIHESSCRQTDTSNELSNKTSTQPEVKTRRATYAQRVQQRGSAKTAK